MFDTRQQKIDFAYCAAQSYIDNNNRDAMVIEINKQYPNISIDFLEMIWRCIDAHEDLTSI